ncbi:DUF815 domain-containing protein [Lentisphaerota bacterium ZTH]|nr:DUF815 domain-containing protein [Lentisphaerota bacterium]WET06346.1 DUF815 domain-containing protein [Lentisphaerota bacterium ZTH]
MTLKQKKFSVQELTGRLNSLIASLNVLFTEVNNGDKVYMDIFRLSFIKSYDSCLRAALNELIDFESSPYSKKRLYSVIDRQADSIDLVNQLLRESGGGKIPHLLEAAAFDALIGRQAVKINRDGSLKAGDDGEFMLQHADRLCNDTALLKDYFSFLETEADMEGLPRLHPEALKLFSGKSAIKLDDGKVTESTLKSLRVGAAAADPFHCARVFRYSDEKFIPARLDNIRAAGKFYGYEGPRRIFNEHFKDFAEGRSNVPLLISSLPGLGKTHYAIAYTLAHENLTLVLPEPEDIEKPLERLLTRLEARHDHRFVIFFDDIDPANTNWYYFRTNIGGSLQLPENVCLIAASNHYFPPNIVSRGRMVTFPRFDELRCMDMIEDFLKELGMRHCPKNLVYVVAEDYCEQYGQKKFGELSPRTLIRYLDGFKKDLKKRRRMLEISRGEMVPKPDPQLFYEFNVKLMRSIYGEGAIDALREERLKNELGTI